MSEVQITDLDDCYLTSTKTTSLVLYTLFFLFFEIFFFVLTPSVEEEEDDDDPHDEDEAHEDQVPRVSELSGGRPPHRPRGQVSGEHHRGAQLDQLAPVPVKMRGVIL